MPGDGPFARFSIMNELTNTGSVWALVESGHQFFGGDP